VNKSKLVTAIKSVTNSITQRKFVQCSTEVARDCIRRETRNGVEHIVVSSATLPDDIVMNGGLYPAEEIEKSFSSLERTLAPLEHPTDADGNFISANDPYAIANFYVGAYNENVRRENGRVWVDKVINIAEAKKSEKGKRLLDRLNEIETMENPRPINTSVGVWLEVETVDAPKTNAAGQEYDWVARNMHFDHDAILLDSVGAAQPHQGVGIAVNMDGEEIEVERVTAPDVPVSARSLLEQLELDVKTQTGVKDIDDLDIVGETVVFKTENGWYQVPFVVDTNTGLGRITGLPLRVERQIVYKPKQNSKEGDAMKELLINALQAAGIEVEGLSDEQILQQYNELLASQSGDDDAADEASQLADIVANAVAPLADKIDGLESKLNEKADNERDELAGLVANSGRYPGLDAESAKLLPVDKLKEMAANCKDSFGLPFGNVQESQQDEFAAPVNMPK